jgi:hypothetical protein
MKVYPLPPDAITSTSDTIIVLNQRNSLATLPSPDETTLSLRTPWQSVSSAVMARELSCDHGLLAVWRMRGFSPEPLNPSWTVGNRHAFRVSSILRFLHARHGRDVSEVSIWQTYLQDVFGLEHLTQEDARIWAHRLASQHGSNASEADGVKFRSAGWIAFLDDLLLL